MAQSLSESTYSPRSGRVRLLFSALRPLLDSELDEKDQIARLLMEQLAVAVFGSGAVGDGFKLLSPAAIPGNENTFTVLPGFGYFQGMLVQLLDPIVVSGLSTPVGPRTDYVYLDWSFVEVDSLTDPTILGLVYPPGGGSPTSPETATRETIEVSIGVAEGVPIPAPPAGTQRIRIASLTRPAANPFINGTVTDERELWRHTYVGEGLRVSSAGAGFDVDVEAGQYWSAGVIRNPIATTVTLPTANTTYYIYADSAGVIGFDSYPPLDAFQVVLAKVQTPAAGPIPDEGILDMRPWQAVHARVEREVMDARGTLPTLSDYLLTEHNPDGTHNLAAVFSGAIDRNNWIDLLPEEDPGGPSLRVYVNPGRYTTPSGERTLDFPGGLSPNFIPPLPIAPNRIDLLTIDDFGALNITQGTPTPLAPTAPIYPEDQMVIAEVTVVYNPKIGRAHV